MNTHPATRMSATTPAPISMFLLRFSMLASISSGYHQTQNRHVIRGGFGCAGPKSRPELSRESCATWRLRSTRRRRAELAGARVVVHVLHEVAVRPVGRGGGVAPVRAG